MFNFRRKTREEIAAEGFDPAFDLRDNRGPDPKSSFAVFARRSPPQFSRMEMSPGVNFYSANCRAKNLIVGFGGSRGRLNMAVYMILQNLDARRHDLLLLSDNTNAHFDNGVAGYADSLIELMSRVRDFAATRKYRSLITYGCSMGGFPALRGGTLLRADRAISIGGRFPFHPARIGTVKNAVRPFDVLCACRQPFRAPFYLLYAQGQSEDDRNASIVHAIDPTSRVIRLPGYNHNFPHELRQNGKLDLFFSEMFDLTREPSQEKLAALLEPDAGSILDRDAIVGVEGIPKSETF